MTPVPGWQAVLKRSWSIRFSVLSALLTGLDFAMPYLMPEHPTRLFVVLAGCAAAASAGARLIFQWNLHKPDA